MYLVDCLCILSNVTISFISIGRQNLAISQKKLPAMYTVLTKFIKDDMSLNVPPLLLNDTVTVNVYKLFIKVLPVTIIS